MKRLPPPIEYNIEPLPDKIQVDVERGASKDQALLGDPYEIKIKFEKKDNIKLKSLAAVFMDFSTLPVGYEDGLAGGSGAQSFHQDDFASVSLSTADGKSANTAGPSNARESMLNSSMAQFYNLAKSHSVANLMGGNTYIGADPRIGVAVIRSQLSKSSRLDSQALPANAPIRLRGIVSPNKSPRGGSGSVQQNAFTEDFLEHVGAGVEEDFEPIELYYTKEVSSNDKERKIPIMSRDKAVKTLDIKTETKA